MANNLLVIPGPLVLDAATCAGGTSNVAIEGNVGSSTVSDPFTYVNGGVGYTNSYVDLALNGYQNTSYYKDAAGFVHLILGAKSGTGGASIFTLPEGYRPFLGHVIAQIYVDAGALNYIKVVDDGTVYCLNGGGTTQVIGSITFLAAQTLPG